MTVCHFIASAFADQRLVHSRKCAFGEHISVNSLVHIGCMTSSSFCRSCLDIGQSCTACGTLLSNENTEPAPAWFLETASELKGECSLCKMTDICYADFVKHTIACTKNSGMFCKYKNQGCSELFQHKAADRLFHELTCTYAITQCIGSRYGCTKYLTHSDKAAHTNQCNAAFRVLYDEHMLSCLSFVGKKILHTNACVTPFSSPVSSTASEEQQRRCHVTPVRSLVRKIDFTDHHTTDEKIDILPSQVGVSEEISHESTRTAVRLTSAQAHAVRVGNSSSSNSSSSNVMNNWSDQEMSKDSSTYDSTAMGTTTAHSSESFCVEQTAMNDRVAATNKKCGKGTIRKNASDERHDSLSIEYSTCALPTKRARFENMSTSVMDKAVEDSNAGTSEVCKEAGGALWDFACNRGNGGFTEHKHDTTASDSDIQGMIIVPTKPVNIKFKVNQKFTEADDAIIRRAFLCLEGWKSYPDPNTGDNSVSSERSAKHVWRRMAEHYFPNRHTNAEEKTAFTKQLRNYCRRFVKSIVGPRDADASAEGDAILNEPFTKDEKKVKRPVKVRKMHGSASACKTSSTLVSIPGAALHNDVPESFDTVIGPHSSMLIDSPKTTNNTSLHYLQTLMDHFTNGHRQKDPRCILCNQNCDASSHLTANTPTTDVTSTIESM